MEESMTMFRLGTALVLTTLMTTGAFARGGGHGGAMGHGGTAKGELTQPLLPAPPIDDSIPTLTGPVGSPPSSLSTPSGTPLGLPAGTLYPRHRNSPSSVGAGASGSFGTTPPDVTPAMPSVTATMPGLGTPQIMVPEPPM
jgi:hypothetical protein